MQRLESDPATRRWTNVTTLVRWLDDRHCRHSYGPDFLVEKVDGRLQIIEVKAAGQVDSPAVQRKRAAAELWCKRRGMEYSIATIG